MRQPLTIRNTVDGDGNPAGGVVTGNKLTIHWQDGPVDVVPNGAFVEDVLEACQKRLEFYQHSKFACTENADAIGYINQARGILAERFARREAAGIANSREGN